ncbi:MAG: hypothetical protein A3I61_15620 [Acidobacteria bacterium RIFCSPLOWO2_02_FULL_68_18]|nr:MAG: hypothetical protein A3I61_15620 [Acidobacteria bacterium RIFCSPLOWO2_02_FULL_68_18]OFW50524.1 MAG: hypothetical protein A3G77_00315 [Acidobacteria bacterium RIFCSPLOWO2_12_FULL_68_19]
MTGSPARRALGRGADRGDMRPGTAFEVRFRDHDQQDRSGRTLAPPLRLDSNRRDGTGFTPDRT